MCSSQAHFASCHGLKFRLAPADRRSGYQHNQQRIYASHTQEVSAMLSSVISRLNDRRDAAADLGEDAGFTLIELVVVLLILAILLAIAIPTFLGVTGGANDRAAQSNLNTALTTAKSAETQNGQSYNTTGGGSANISSTSLSLNEPSITFSTTAVTGAGP